MEIIDLLFKIVSKFVPVNQSALMGLEAEAKDWRVKLEGKDAELDWIGKIYKRIHKPWPVRLLIAILYIPIVNSFVNVTPPVQNPDVEYN